jgi:hypothetical protein
MSKVKRLPMADVSTITMPDLLILLNERRLFPRFDSNMSVKEQFDYLIKYYDFPAFRLREKSKPNTKGLYKWVNGRRDKERYWILSEVWAWIRARTLTEQNPHEAGLFVIEL